MDDDRKNAYQQRFQARIEEWEAKLDQLTARARRAEADLRLKLQDEESDLRKKLDEARERLKELRAASEDGWEEIRSGADRLWNDLRAAWERSAAEAPSPSSDEPPTGDQQDRGSSPGP